MSDNKPSFLPSGGGFHPKPRAPEYAAAEDMRRAAERARFLETCPKPGSPAYKLGEEMRRAAERARFLEACPKPGSPAYKLGEEMRRAAARLMPRPDLLRALLDGHRPPSETAAVREHEMELGKRLAADAAALAALAPIADLRATGVAAKRRGSVRPFPTPVSF